MTALLVILLVGAGYSYFLYPLALAAVVLYKRRGMVSGPRPNASEEFAPKVTFIVTAYNEEARIHAKLRNCRAIDYPHVEIIVASDCSTDGTDNLVRQFRKEGVRLVRVDERRGKEFAQQRALSQSDGDILVFSDVGTSMDPGAVRRIVRYFADETVGAVSSEDRFVREDGTIVGEGVYVRYEMMLRRLESQLGGLVGLSGSFFAARRVVCESWDIETPSDFNTAMCCARLGLRAVTAMDVVGFYRDLKNPANEYQRKVRTVLRGMTGLAYHREIMSLQRHGWFAWQVISHKLMRWLVPAFLVGLFLLSAMMYEISTLARMLFVAQCATYAVALLTHCLPGLRCMVLPRLIYFFCQVNIAIVHAVYRYVTGQRVTTWQPSAR